MVKYKMDINGSLKWKKVQLEPNYNKNSLSLAGVAAMGTGVMIGAGIFALTGQVAELSGPLFPLAFLVAAMVSGFSAYTYVKMFLQD